MNKKLEKTEKTEKKTELKSEIKKTSTFKKKKK